MVTFKGRELTFRKREKAAAGKKVLDSLIHNGNYKYTRVFYPAVDTRGRRFRTLRSLVKLQIQRVCINAEHYFLSIFSVWHVENAVLKCEDLFWFLKTAAQPFQSVQEESIRLLKAYSCCHKNISFMYRKCVVLKFKKTLIRGLPHFDSLAAF